MDPDGIVLTFNNIIFDDLVCPDFMVFAMLILIAK
jgi:hypothetical protein